jgi:hypothetical protein
MTDANRPSHRLSKSRFVDGLQCHRLLWWKVHEPDAPELTPPPQEQVVLDRGTRVGELARAYVPGGVFIDFPYYELRERVAATAEAINAGAAIVYEASFIADRVFVSVDILERVPGGHALVEVKSTVEMRAHHIPDVAIQVYVAQRSGIHVARAEIMHLNRECRYPDISNLFVREPVTGMVEPELHEAAPRIESMLAALAGPLPDVAPGPHCTSPRACPFMGRCWPPMPDHHVTTIYKLPGKKKQELLASGVETIFHLADDYPLSGAARRQVESVRRGEMIVEPGLRDALESLAQPIAFLDFESIAPAVPVWPGCGPYQNVPVQFSVHLLSGGALEHRAWMAAGPDDPRAALAAALLEACAGAGTVLVYNETFERQCIDGLLDALPHLAPRLRSLLDRIRDLLPIVRDHVYHPAFGGKFGIKAVLPALVPGPGYDVLEIQEGRMASAILEQLLLNPESFGDEERASLRAQLLRYCEFDTLAMVKLHARLRELADAARP